MLLRALSPSSPWPMSPPGPLGSGQRVVTAAVCYFTGHGAGEDREVGQFPPPRGGQGALELEPGASWGVGIISRDRWRRVGDRDCGVAAERCKAQAGPVPVVQGLWESLVI